MLLLFLVVLRQLQKICDDDDHGTVSDGEKYLAALTSAER